MKYNAALENDLSAMEVTITPHLTFDALSTLRQSTPSVCTHYGEIDAVSMRRVLLAIGCGPGAVLLDVGCGAGRWLSAALSLGASRAVGVEYVPERAAVAQSVLGDRAQVLVGRAEDVDAVWEAGPTHVIFYDFACPLEDVILLYKRAAATKTVLVVVTWKRDVVVPGFRPSRTIRTTTPAGEKYVAYAHTRTV